ncbi:MAG: LysM peptidoglycan-binding domain-containing protein [Gammaproteobacteria bacterium]|nr:LysM peptidoglycan-binding domain-containing protein [Gammaproteobacteria bacterium]
MKDSHHCYSLHLCLLAAFFLAGCTIAQTSHHPLQAPLAAETSSNTSEAQAIIADSAMDALPTPVNEPVVVFAAEPLQQPAAATAIENLNLSQDISQLNEVVAATTDSAVEVVIEEPSQVPVDLWQRLRNGFGLNDHKHPSVQRDRQWYLKHPEYIERVVERARPYLYFIVEEIETRGIPAEIALLPVVESAFQPFAYSHGRAAGLWQFIPGTARHFGLKKNWWYEGRRDVRAATHAALTYLQQLNRRFDGDWLLALAAYNSGEGTVQKAVRKNRRAGKATDFWSLKLPRETRGYVPKLLAISSIVATPQRYQIEIAPIPNEPYFAVVNSGSQIDLALVAELADLSVDAVYRLNPAFNRWATDPAGSHELLLPRDRAARFEERLALLPAHERVRWQRHKIREGETLGHIAKRYQTTVSVLRQTNHIKGNNIRAGKYMIIPVATQALSQYSMTEKQRQLARQSVNRKGSKRVHHVVEGDTLWDLARFYGVRVRQIASWNGFAPGDQLHLGQRLVIWSKSMRVAQQQRIPVALPTRPSVLKRINYRVRNGDSLARISQRFNVSVSQLRRWNGKIARQKYLKPGQRLVVFVDVIRAEPT